MKFLKQKLTNLIVRILYEIFCLDKRGDECRTHWIDSFENDNEYIYKIRLRHKMILDSKAKETMEELFDRLDNKNQELLNRVITIESVFNTVTLESFIDDIARRINEKQLK